jgi:ABC-type transport system involved in multi-copper enzyme maturation permease subunit
LSRWRTLGLAALPAAVAGLSIALDEHRGAQDAARVAAGELATATAITGFGSTAAALQTGLPLLALVVAGLASQMLAGELARGTLRNVLLRPLTRLEVVAGKALAGAALVLGAYLALLAVTLTASAAAFGFGDLVEILPNGAHFPLVAAAELRMDLLRALAAPVVALLAFFTLGVACGALARGPASALGLALGVVLGLDLARAAARGLGAEEWLLTAYLPTPLGDTSYLHHFADRAQGISNSLFELDRAFAGIPQDLALPLLWAALAFALASNLFSRRDVP